MIFFHESLKKVRWSAVKRIFLKNLTFHQKRTFLPKTPPILDPFSKDSPIKLNPKKGEKGSKRAKKGLFHQNPEGGVPKIGGPKMGVQPNWGLFSLKQAKTWVFPLGIAQKRHFCA